ncbi:MAG: hypothetical protein KF819_36245 [Labilithrix sp.]|nr:hypothetical protein [Labilithrix sp.]
MIDEAIAALSRVRRGDIFCHTNDLSARTQFHNGNTQKKRGIVVDPRLLFGIQSRVSDLSPAISIGDRPGGLAVGFSTWERQLAEIGFSNDELEAIERANPEGLSVEAIIGLLSSRSIKLTESTLRKYVQLGLLPRSRRVGLKGGHRGSLGLYPAGVVRRIQRLRTMMESYTIDEIKQSFLIAAGDVEELEHMLGRILSRVRNSDAESRDVNEAQRLADALVAKIHGIERRLDLATEPAV